MAQWLGQTSRSWNVGWGLNDMGRARDFLDGLNADDAEELLLETIFNWFNAGCDISYYGQSNGTIRYFIRNTEDGVHVFRERMEIRGYGPGSWWGLPVDLGRPAAVLSAKLFEIINNNGEDI